MGSRRIDREATLALASAFGAGAVGWAFGSAKQGALVGAVASVASGVFAEQVTWKGAEKENKRLAGAVLAPALLFLAARGLSYNLSVEAAACGSFGAVASQVFLGSRIKAAPKGDELRSHNVALCALVGFVAGIGYSDMFTPTQGAFVMGAVATIDLAASHARGEVQRKNHLFVQMGRVAALWAIPTVSRELGIPVGWAELGRGLLLAQVVPLSVEFINKLTNK